MKRRTFLKNSSAAGLVALITPTGIIRRSSQATDAGSLATNFLTPPASARPQTWWHWMNGNVTADGITRDLEAMQQIGLGGFQNFDAGTGIPKGPVQYLSPEWLKLKEHTIKEAERLGLEFTMHNCPGWSSSGGPWITPELAMQQVTWSEAYVDGGKTVALTLPKPLTRLGYYRDVQVLAFPSLPGEVSLSKLIRQVTTGNGAVDSKLLTGESPEGATIRPAEGAKSAYLQLEFNEPFEARSIAFVSKSVPGASESGGQGGFGGGPAFTLEASDDGNQFRKVVAGTLSRSADDDFSMKEFPATKARFFRLTTAIARNLSQLRFSGSPRLTDWMKKVNTTFNGVEVAPASANLDSVAIKPESIANLTQYMDKEGALNWNAPAGQWTILRIGFTPLGALNRSAPDTGVGLECDKYSKTAITFHFNKMMVNLLPTLGPLAQKGKVGLLIDSYEIGMQNWSPEFPQEFGKRAGYDLVNYLPTLTGRLVGSVDTTERFLWDFRRIQADLMADNYYGQFTELCHQHNLIAYTEPYDRGPMEEMQIGARVDVNMGEFWNGLSTLFQNNWTMRRTTKLAASIAHVNGKGDGKPQVVGAEAFTGEPESARWQEYPFAMKATGDKMFTQGLNRIIFHRYAHQPHPTALPGMTMGPWGIHFDRTTTWWSVGKGWVNYLSRCQYLLQQGLFVADLAYFTGESGGLYTKVSPDELNPAPPQGHDYDLINAEVILRRVKIENNRIVLPDGMSYRVLVLQDYKTITLELLRKLRELVHQGMCLVGAKPERTPGLRDYAAGEPEFKRIVDELWGNINGTTLTENRVGKGSVYWGIILPTVLEKLSVKPDFEVSSRSGDAPITYIHRRIGQTDLYFLANQRRTTEELVCTFRVNGRQPELWDANTGTITSVGIYEETDGRIRVPVQLDPSGSVFIVFREPAAGKQLQWVLKDAKQLVTTKPFPAVTRTLYKDVTDNFSIDFWAKPESNVMLSTRNFMDNIADPWTDYYTIYPPSGKDLYGEGHETCGLTVGRNGVAIWHHGAGKPVFILAAPTAISGWSHIALVYQAGAPSVYVNGKLIQRGENNGKVIHPGIGKAYLNEGASYYNGDMSIPQVVGEVFNEAQIQKMAAELPYVEQPMPVVAIAGAKKAGLMIWQDGRYTLRDSAGRDTAFQISGLGKAIELTGPWQVRFPPDLGAPATIKLPRLASLHTHTDEGVKHFSGTATYSQTVSFPASKLGNTKRVWLDLGRVEVIAEVRVNGKELGILWKRPYQVDVTEAMKAGANTIEIRVTNLWPNRLIGDENRPEEAKYTPGGGASGFASLSNGAIEQLPDWYQQSKPKPAGGRITFTTWKHYTKDSPLLESGLIGPVTLRVAELKSLDTLLAAKK
ncbi:glycosyl hydrolase family 43 [Spirosoma aureum]|uniref:Glycosyl hydrolase family 43 n=1 Tax=Spirosoma aureum TaxID=2692134 RepID=A0A6G9AJL0_9BACT|nr:glycosyl hydrolase [Spirosoma aureum]QIP12638.1 glycosyl hydrolase family 43 [Spirosoma aureum]